MSIGGDIVSEVIALLQPVHDAFDVHVREYGGELDDKDKDNFKLPKHLYDGGGVPISSVMAEYAGVEHKPQDTGLLVYLNTYKVHVWIIAGYIYSTTHKEGGAPLQNAGGLSIYDAVLDCLVARNLLKDAERLKLERSSRFFYGSYVDLPDNEPFNDGDVAALVYKLEFSLRAQSVWADPPQVEAMTWYSAAGPVVEQGGFQADVDVLISPYIIDFSERAEQPLPVARTDWRSAYPSIPVPTAMFPCADPLTNADQIVDVVDGLTLAQNSGDPVLHRQVAAGLYAQDWQGMTRFNPRRALEFKDGDWSSFQAEDPLSLNPMTSPLESICGFMVARFRKPPTDTITLMGKPDAAGPGWRVYMTTAGMVGLEARDSSSQLYSLETTVNHATGSWTYIMFYILFQGDPATAVFAGIETSKQVLGTGFDGLDTLKNDTSQFIIGGESSQYCLANYWQVSDDALKRKIFLNRRALWKGLVYPVNVTPDVGLMLRRNNTIGFVTGRSMANGDVVTKFPDRVNLRVQQDQYQEVAGQRMLPYDRLRANLIEYSEDFTQWGSVGGLVTGPDGELSAYELNEGQTITTTEDAIINGFHVLSVWARTTTADGMTLALEDVSETFKLTRRWTRLFVRKEITVPATLTVGITAIGDTDSNIEIWGAQLDVAHVPSAYIPTAGEPIGDRRARFQACHVDWTVLPGPSEARGKVQVSVVPGDEMLELESTFVAFEVTNADSKYLRVVGDVTIDGDKRWIVWRLIGELPDSNTPNITAPEPVPLEANTPLEVGIRWYQGAVELLVEGELAGRASLSVSPAFNGDPERCFLMRNRSGSNGSKWIGACKDVRWWR